MLILILAVVLFAAACRRAEEAQRVIAPTATVTPRSTPLPALATPVPPGDDDNPIRVVLRPAAAGAAAQRSASQLASALEEETGLAYEVVLVDRAAEALAALCESVTGTVSVAWLDGVTYAAAVASECGAPLMQIERDDETGARVQIIADRSAEYTSARALADARFCRISYDDFYTWLVPSIMLQANGVSPLSDLAAVDDQADVVELLEAVAAGQCDAAGLSEADFEAEANATVREAVDILETSPAIPYAVLVAPAELSLGARESLVDALLDIGTGRASPLFTLLDVDGLEEVDSSDLNSVLQFVRSSGLDLAQLDS